MRGLATLVCVLALCAPLVVEAHATPVSYEPGSSATLGTGPAEVSIRFSERLEDGASSLKVEGGGSIVSQGSARVDLSDTRRLSIFLGTLSQGTYKVTWSVVSADDGHFTRGSYFFAVGEAVATSSSVEEFELVTKTANTEALGMTAELMGNGFLWAVLLFFAFGVRPILKSFVKERPLVERLCTRVVWGAAALMLCGGLIQLGVKASDLSGLHDIGFWQGSLLYIGTAGGLATLWRIGAVILFTILFTLLRKKIFIAERFTVYEGVLVVTLGVFAYFRAIISHATANPFNPEFSIFINFLHVIEKDFWAGMAGLVLLLVLNVRLRRFLQILIPRVFFMMAVSTGAVAMTACYIVWLHLKTFENLFTTTWGSVFLQLSIAATLLLALRTYHVLAQGWRPSVFARYFSATAALEFVFGVLVVYCSSVAILTSPPLLDPSARFFSANSEGATIHLEKSPVEDNMLLLTVPGAEPTVTLAETSLQLKQRFSGGYVLPLALMPEIPTELTIVAPQTGRYDAKASFVVSAQDFTVPAGWEKKRPFTMFTGVAIFFALVFVLYALLLARLSLRRPTVEYSLEGGGRQVLVGATVAFMLGWCFVFLLPASGILTPFKSLCESDGNMWHLMLPTKAGVPTSQIPQEGCMWGMGNYIYMFGDKREYEHVRALPEAETSLTFASHTLVAGVPEQITLSLKEVGGEPATLFVDMEKYVHLVIISKDQSTFAHIHAKETPEEIQHSTFSFDYTFPKAGEYMVSVDYAHGVTLASKQFIVQVEGVATQNVQVIEYPSKGVFDGYEVSLAHALPVVGEVETLRYVVTKDGKEVTNLEQYLSAAMHISVVKNDFSAFMHLHGEIHASGTPSVPSTVRNGKIVHSMAAMMNVPLQFGPNIEAHTIFPSPGVYTVWGEFKVGGKVIPTAFTLRVEE